MYKSTNQFLSSFLLVSFGFTLLLPHTSVAQRNITTQNLLWTRFDLNLKIAPSYKIQQELEERVYWFPWRQHQFLARTQVLRSLGKNWNAALGFTYLLQSVPQIQDSEIIATETELRPQFGFTYKQLANNKLVFTHRYWFEFRFFERQQSHFPFNNVRARYQFTVDYQLGQKLKIRAFDEIFLNIGQKVGFNIFDQNRIGFSIIYDFNKSNGLEIGFFNWFQERPTGIDFFSRNIVRVTYHLTLDFEKKQQ